ncbi:MAG: hypothetical protein KME50_31285 [Nostoc desertorum CM1-VF14]|jgi:hypothetical protein|nr:hypothetical protein [Nostoc desertorum CM1-VF14]
MNTQKPGIHVKANENLIYFTEEEKKIVRKFSEEWYVTGAGNFKINQRSEYRYFLIKATQIYQEMFGFERELIVIFSPYETFQPRSIDAIDSLYDSVLKKYQALRIERICSIIISRDKQVEEKIRKILKESQESQVIIPISYTEIINNTEVHFLQNKFKNNFYTRNLFDFQSPLRKDLYFFGRTDLINKIGNRHFSNENSGLFGLRKSGKTSFIYALQRQMNRVNAASILISCDDPSFQNRRWNECLHYILFRIKKECKLSVQLQAEENYTEKNAAIIFEDDLLKIYKAINKKSILIIFDEIERITFKISSSSHWNYGKDFIYFWQTLRTKFHKMENVFSYLLVGTNPSCIETSKITVKENDIIQNNKIIENQYDNPIFNSIPIEYLERFDISQTKEMVGKLGNFMGLSFEESIYSKLTDDYGGHPFLIRQVCSVIHQQNKQNIPVKIDRIMYSLAKDEFEKYGASRYIQMMLDVLLEFYPDEYIMLESLAIGDISFFKSFANESPEYTAHLKGYGIISQNLDNYDFKIDIAKQYLENKNKYKKLHLTNEEMLQEISQRRNSLEPKLRNIIRMQLSGRYGQSKAKEIVLSIIKNSKKEYDNLPYKDLFDPDQVNIYFDKLKQIVNKEWSIFEHIFDNKNQFDSNMTIVNDNRADAHAKEITTSKMIIFRESIGWLEEHVDKFLNGD